MPENVTREEFQMFLKGLNGDIDDIKTDLRAISLKLDNKLDALESDIREVERGRVPTWVMWTVGFLSAGFVGALTSAITMATKL